MSFAMSIGADQPWNENCNERCVSLGPRNASRPVCFVLALLIYGANLPCAIGQAVSDIEFATSPLWIN